jgi:hypothetical protein
MKNKNNFRILRFFKDGKCVSAINITAKQASSLTEYFDDAYVNMGGGITWTYKVNLAD